MSFIKTSLGMSFVHQKVSYFWVNAWHLGLPPLNCIKKRVFRNTSSYGSSFHNFFPLSTSADSFGMSRVFEIIFFSCCQGLVIWSSKEINVWNTILNEKYFNETKKRFSFEFGWCRLNQWAVNILVAITSNS